MRKFEPDELAGFSVVLERLLSKEFMKEWESFHKYISTRVIERVGELPGAFHYDFPSTLYASEFNNVAGDGELPGEFVLQCASRFNEDEYAVVPYEMLIDPYGWAEKKIESYVHAVKLVRAQKDRAVREAAEKVEREERAQLEELLRKYPDAR